MQRYRELKNTVLAEAGRVRTYDFKSGIVRDHRTGKQASIKEVLVKGNIEKLK